MKIPIHLWFLFLVCTITIGCHSSRKLPAQIFTSDAYCQALSPSTTQYDSLLAIQLAQDTVFSPDLQARFSQRARSVAADIGILPLLTRLVQLDNQQQQSPDTDLLLQMVAARQEITERISLVSLEVSSVLDEINCEIGRATEMKNFLQVQVEKRETSSTILSVLIAASAQIVVSAMNLSDADQRLIETTEIGGALLSGYFAYRALKKKDKKAVFLHKRNFLTDIQNNSEQSTIYRPMVWHYLTKEYENLQETRTVRQTILQRWEELPLLRETEQEEQQQRLSLLFSTGGLYSLDDIDTRISLLDLLAIEISLMNQELKQLQQEITLGSKEKK
ncbi:hypothetical protein Q0590_10155 [Rhodocytophaga aerolata]|uniref:Uncharacterized protein n=1 Tax=Rhodocytophaga aerolata TaxID=455078 RepID=A0ABT8R3V2_9BACT|nr:hypothetical protein [Rhodocytophaga aerolata]MDO1446614.1 hypothetical protein [Rhodocytophaga aerolata]